MTQLTLGPLAIKSPDNMISKYPSMIVNQAFGAAAATAFLWVKNSD